MTMNGEESSYFMVAEQKRWRSIRIMYLVLFLNSTGFSILLPSLWPYLQHISPSVNYSFLGFAAAGYSFGQLLASPLVGKWSTVRGKITLPVQLTMFIGVVGNLLYALACLVKDSSPTGALWVVVIGRVISGGGAGCIALARSHLGTVTSLDERTAVVSKGSMAQAAGFIIGPGLALVTSLVQKGFCYESWEVSQYTLPAYLSAILITVNMVIVAVWFREDATPAEFMVNSIVQSSEMATLRVKWSGIVICNALFYIAMLSFTVMETLNTPIIQAELGLSQTEAIKYSSIFLTCTSVFSFMTFAIATPLGKRFGERKMMGIAFSMSAFAYILFYPVGPGYIPRIQWTPLSNVSISNPNNTEVTGCNWQNKWCHTQHRLNIAQFLVANSILLFSYPLGVVLLLSRTSKILGPHPQGTVMGILTAVGSFSRAVGPAIFTSLFQAFGPPAMVYVLAPALSIAPILVFLGSNHLETFESRHEKLQRDLFT
ncbi:major facilitator superfamily domain-containing protein 8-like isoform X2 [Bolinopsis microptera]|uniref:major facilitator superfamily domain-containing protein 8-like isoform X2 n=1 Tax=Bolinopsis microptera TaxID=2820187 RepID=UPI00307AD116